MCGVSGYIGKSTYPELSAMIIDNLFKRLELRGKDASGFWGCDSKGNIFYHKEPSKSSNFVDTAIWKKVTTDYSPNLLLVHARNTSPTSGHARTNKNNHPFVSSNKRIGVVHNGVLYESPVLKKLFEINSSTDSELFLRMYESDPDRMVSLSSIFSKINKGHMAVAVGEKITNDEMNLYLFRNVYRPLCVVDLRELVGQIFFVSNREVWDAAIGDCEYKCDLIEVPVHELWHFNLKNDQIEINKYKANFSELVESELTGINPIKITPGTLSTDEKLITELNEHEEIDYAARYKNNPTPIYPYQNKFAQTVVTQSDKTAFNYPEIEDDDSGFNIIDDTSSNKKVSAVEKEIKEIKSILEDIDVMVNNASIEGSITEDKIKDLVESLKQTKMDLKSTLAITESVEVQQGVDFNGNYYSHY